MPAATEPESGWSTQVVWGVDALDALRADWDRLFLRCSAATPFQSGIWLSSWCRWYGPANGRLCVIGVRYDGVLVAAAAFALTRLKLWRVLRPVGVEQSDFCDVLVDDSGDGVPDVPAIVAQLSAAIRNQVRFDVLDFPDVRPGSVLARVRDTWPGGTLELPCQPCLHLPGVPMDQHAGTIEAAKTRQRMRKNVRDLGKAGLEVRLVPVDEAEEAMARFVELHRRQWADRSVNSEHLTERFKSHLTTVLRDSVEAGESSGFQALLTEFSLKDEETLEMQHVASDLLIVGRSMVGRYLYCYLPSVRSRIDVFLAITCTAMTLTTERGIPEFSLLRGAEPHKYRLHPDQTLSVRISLANGVWGAVGLRAIRGRRFATRAVKALLRRCPPNRVTVIP